MPGKQAKLLASREVEFVVVDPSARLSSLADGWQPVLTVDPANPSWWQRLPAWAQAARLGSRPPGAVGNVRPLVRGSAAGEYVELPPSLENDDPSWQAYTLAVRELNVPHLVEVEYPDLQEQQLSICMIEPNATGRVSTIYGSGFYTEKHSVQGDGEFAVHRFVFWPRTRSPQLLIVNQHPSATGQYGKIRLLRHDNTSEELQDLSPKSQYARLVADYISKPTFAGNFGAAERLDQASGLSVHSWSTFLESANRLAQQLRLNGKNAILVSVAADGSAIYPSEVIGPSPRYDTGMLASTGQDPLRKDVLEMLLRVLDREGIRVIPTVQLATPLPRLERQRLSIDSADAGLAWIGPDGKAWSSIGSNGRGETPYYNALHDEVQAEIVELALELSRRYGKHESFGGVGMQLSSKGYGVLPGLKWGMDDTTAAAFTADTGTSLPSVGENRFRQRAAYLSGEGIDAWRTWRTQKVSGLYAKISERLATERSDLQLVLTTEDLFAGEPLQRRLRYALSDRVNLNEALLDHGIDLQGINQTRGVTALAPYRLGAEAPLQKRALDLRINVATDHGELLPLADRSAALFFHASEQVRLPSFDLRGSFGGDQTSLVVTTQPTPAGTARRRQLVSALARSDAFSMVEGGIAVLSGADLATRQLLETVQELPGIDAESHTSEKQPIVMRVYRSGESTTITLINESPWPVSVQLPLEAAEVCRWQKLGMGEDAVENALSIGSEEWQVELKPFDLQAWQFESTGLKVGDPKIALDDLARLDLEQRIGEIESRTGNLIIRREYLQLQNPGFELKGEEERIVGWQPRRGAAGRIELNSLESHSGQYALRLVSEDGVGVAAQSHLFSMPETGQLMVSAYLRGEKVHPDARLYIAFEDAENGRTYQRFDTLGGNRPLERGWSRYEFYVDDIPLIQNGQMKLQFHLTGDAELLIDDIELYDLRFDKSRRGALVKGVLAAKAALDEGRVLDCWRLVDEYWPRYLVEYVPPLEAQGVQLAKQPPSPQPEAEKEAGRGMGSRLRSWVPKIWR